VLHVDLSVVVLRSIYLFTVGRQIVIYVLFFVADYQENGTTSGSCTLQFNRLFVCLGHQAQFAASHIPA
jgi:hypothetical protein